jgi:hypothetical protein
LRERSTDSRGLSQKWNFEPYKKIEQGLEMAKTNTSLHKKEGFGVPRGGYGTEIGCPPELTSLPENNPIVCDIDSSSSMGQQQSGFDDYDPYDPSFYQPTGASQAPPPLPQRGPILANSNSPAVAP